MSRADVPVRFSRSASQSWQSFKRRRPNWWDQHRNELISFPLSQLLRQGRSLSTSTTRFCVLSGFQPSAGAVGSFPGVVSTTKFLCVPMCENRAIGRWPECVTNVMIAKTSASIVFQSQLVGMFPYCHF